MSEVEVDTPKLNSVELNVGAASEEVAQAQDGPPKEEQPALSQKSDSLDESMQKRELYAEADVPEQHKVPYFSKPKSKPASVKKVSSWKNFASLEVNRLQSTDSEKRVSKFDEQRK